MADAVVDGKQRAAPDRFRSSRGISEPVRPRGPGGRPAFCRAPRTINLTAEIYQEPGVAEAELGGIAATVRKML